MYQKRGAIMNNGNKTLYIPLYAKALVSKKGLFIKDERAEKIWDTEGFALKKLPVCFLLPFHTERLKVIRKSRHGVAP